MWREAIKSRPLVEREGELAALMAVSKRKPASMGFAGGGSDGKDVVWPNFRPTPGWGFYKV